MKYLSWFLISMLLGVSCNNAGAQKVAVEEVLLTPSAQVGLGNKVTLNAIIVPDNADNKNVKWESNKTEIATVSDDGLVSGISIGIAIITVTTNDGSKTANCNVTVVNPVTSVNLNNRNITLAVDKTVQLEATVKPDNANQGISWKSSAPTVASVTDGLVTALKTGIATISASSTENDGLVDYCNITVFEPNEHKIVAAYVLAGANDIPDPAYLTHIYYAFGRIDESSLGLYIGGNINRFLTIMALKNQNPELKVLLSIGGAGQAFSGKFPEIAASPDKRQKFAADCKNMIENRSLDGIDINWEYPWTAQDTDNFTLLMHDLRMTIGSDKLLTYASGAARGWKFFNHKDVNAYVDYINVMCYDIANLPNHQSGLYRSQLTGVGNVTCDEGIMLNHVNNGLPIHKLIFGIPFYCHGRNGIETGTGYAGVQALINAGTHIPQWDDVAKAPYLTNATTGSIDCSYDDPRSIAEKCKYIIDNGMAGAMYWTSDADDSNGTLAKAVWSGLK